MVAAGQAFIDVNGSKAKNQPSLILYAGSGYLRPDTMALLTRTMASTGLTGRRIGQSSFEFLPGDRFLDHISFLGCSPNIALSPEEGEHYCYIRLHEPQSRPVLLSAGNTQPPRCRSCQRTLDEWWQCTAPDFCSQCSLEERQDSLNWRRRGAISRCRIEIMNVYPHEAVPSPNLLLFLKDASGVEWRYAYLQD